jgi:hypothetical protein
MKYVYSLSLYFLIEWNCDAFSEVFLVHIELRGIPEKKMGKQKEQSISVTAE